SEKLTRYASGGQLVGLGSARVPRVGERVSRSRTFRSAKQRARTSFAGEIVSARHRTQVAAATATHFGRRADRPPRLDILPPALRHRRFRLLLSLRQAILCSRRGTSAVVQ